MVISLPLDGVEYHDVIILHRGPDRERGLWKRRKDGERHRPGSRYRIHVVKGHQGTDKAEESLHDIHRRPLDHRCKAHPSILKELGNEEGIEIAGINRGDIIGGRKRLP